MKQIPVKIVEYTISGETRKNVMIDLLDTYEISGNVESKIKKFKKKYFDLIKKSTKIMPKEKSKRKPSHFWQIGKLLNDFHKSIENEFEITNFSQAVNRDFELYGTRQTAAILQLGKEFSKKDISDNVSFSHYLELLFITKMLNENGLLEKEKERLLAMGQNNTLPTLLVYRKELRVISKKLKSGGK